jgi:hypothetical protein
MRGKLIAVFSVVVIVVGLLSFVLMRASLGDLFQNPDRARDEAGHAASAANAELQLRGLNMQRWLTEQAGDPALREPFKAETADSRSQYATTQANRIFSKATSDFPSSAPTIVAFVDQQGIALGRNGSNLLRGDDLGKFYPSLVATTKKGTSGSDVWVNKGRNEQMLVSYSSVREADGKVLGAVLVGTPLDDGLLTAISSESSGKPLLLALPVGEGVEVVAKSSNTPPAIVAAFTGAATKGAVTPALGASKPQQLGGPAEYAISGLGLSGFGDNKRAAIISAAPLALAGDLSALLLWPIVGTTLLGIVLVIISGILLGSYISQPIVELEEGLLAVINGQTDKRFELEHAEFGGLVFRINTLLNTLMGVAEDNTDDQGRPSQAPSAQDFAPALSVDERGTENVDRAAAASLKAEPAAAYYERLYGEYIQAKQSIGDPVAHITKDAFLGKIQASEADAAARQGKPVRYKVELKGREVTLIAVPLD